MVPGWSICHSGRVWPSFHNIFLLQNEADTDAGDQVAAAAAVDLWVVLLPSDSRRVASGKQNSAEVEEEDGWKIETSETANGTVPVAAETAQEDIERQKSQPTTSTTSPEASISKLQCLT
jgi:hypothetical protein